MSWSRLLVVALGAVLCVLGLTTARADPPRANEKRHSHVPINQVDRGANETVDREVNHDKDNAPFALLEATRASHIAARSGDWSAPGSWQSGVPTPGARVVIPHGVTITINAEVPAAIEWVRVEGRLLFAPSNDSKLKATTIFVAQTGELSVGTHDSPLDPNKTAQILFSPRSAEDHGKDVHDVLGGLVSLGRLQIHGAPKAAFATPSNSLQRRVSRLLFLTPPIGWKVGDELLFPATEAGLHNERRRIASILDGGKTIVLSSALVHSHQAPHGARAEVPVGNLTRNVILASAEPGTLHQRGHVMIMTHEATQISGAAFQGLGRTTAARAHTIPSINENGEVVAGGNPIGRYAVHYHLVSGASRALPAHAFSDSVIIDSPKHGLVNHGGHVIAENNVTFAIDGSHFFAENGSEVGAFRRNLAVFSRGSGDRIEARQLGTGDFGHGGHGFWSQSPAVLMEGNYAFHHAGSAYAIFAAAVEMTDGRQNVHFRGTARIANFPRENLEQAQRDAIADKMVPPTTVPFRFSRNAAANSQRGLEIWHTNSISEHNVQSIVEDSIFWDMKTAGIAITYGMNTVIRNSILLGTDPVGCSESACEGSIGITTEGRTRNLIIENVHVARFSTGVRVPMRGTTQISRSHFDNRYNVLMYPAQQPGRKTIVADNTFAKHKKDGEDYRFLEGGQLFQGDISMQFERDQLLVKDQRFPGRTIYRVGQHPGAIPYRNTGIPELDGKTAIRIRQEYGLAIGGALAPASATAIQGIGGLVGAPSTDIAEMADQEKMLARMDTKLATGTGEKSFTTDPDEGYGTDCCNIRRVIKGSDGEPTGWRFMTERLGDRTVTRLTYVDATPPRFKLDPRIKLEIHPNDVQFGFVIEGTLVDDSEGAKTIRKEFTDLKVANDGYVTIEFEYPNRSGKAYHEQLRLRVTTSAVKRGPNLFHYMQAASVGSQPVPAEKARKRRHREPPSRFELFQGFDGRSPLNNWATTQSLLLATTGNV